MALQDEAIRSLSRCDSGWVLGPGEACRFLVNAGTVSTSLPLKMEAGVSYRIEVPANQSWTDWFVPADPLQGDDGNWLINLVDGKRRLPTQPWFVLGVAERRCKGDEDCAETSARPVGTDMLITAPVDAELVFFANDVPCAYWNNCGYVWVKVQRQQAVGNSSGKAGDTATEIVHPLLPSSTNTGRRSLS
ncbi:hypothetical protein [Roseateles sp. DC23W]|uniref:hypothetical protein n=1 Tax=Pelomonas dachongensis TaxID=3299029 RepID=UPI0037495F8F